MKNTIETTDFALECGHRLRRIRQAKGMSQQDIADIFGTSAQNVSKWEHKGLNNINDIKQLSVILGQNLLLDEIEEEGIVGEIGKYILKQTSKNGGFLSVAELNMFGMSLDRTSNEIFKLEKIGMCVREQFKNFYNQNKDMLFITAKGIITLIDITPSEDISTKSYEQILSGKSSVQECYDKREVEKIVRNMKYCGTYKIDYINHLKHKYNTTITDEKPAVFQSYDNRWFLEQFSGKTPDYSVRTSDYKWISEIPFLQSRDCYFDFLFRMVTGLTDVRLSPLIEDTINCRINSLGTLLELITRKKSLLNEYYITENIENPKDTMVKYWPDEALGEISSSIQSDIDTYLEWYREEETDK